MGTCCAKTLLCRSCKAVLANHAGGAAFVSYAHRTMCLTGLAAVKCECGNQQTLAKDFALAPDWKAHAKRVDCPTDGCKATLGYRVGELVIISFQKRVYVCHGLLFVACNECGHAYERDKGL